MLKQFVRSFSCSFVLSFFRLFVRSVDSLGVDFVEFDGKKICVGKKKEKFKRDGVRAG